MTKHSPPTPDHPVVASPDGRPIRTVGATPPATTGTTRRRRDAAVVPLTHPPRPERPVRRVPARWGDALPTPAGSRPDPHDEDGSLVTEYGLVAVLGATIVGLAVRWASDGAITELLAALLARVRELVGA